MLFTECSEVERVSVNRLISFTSEIMFSDSIMELINETKPVVSTACSSGSIRSDHHSEMKSSPPDTMENSPSGEMFQIVCYSLFFILEKPIISKSPDADPIVHVQSRSRVCMQYESSFMLIMEKSEPCRRLEEYIMMSDGITERQAH